MDVNLGTVIADLSRAIDGRYEISDIPDQCYREFLTVINNRFVLSQILMELNTDTQTDMKVHVASFEGLFNTAVISTGKSEPPMSKEEFGDYILKLRDVIREIPIEPKSEVQFARHPLAIGAKSDFTQPHLYLTTYNPDKEG